MNLDKIPKQHSLCRLSYLIILIIIFSCVSSKPELTENHPEIEKLWSDYFDDLNNNYIKVSHGKKKHFKIKLD